jgi:hypothetical protein
MTNPGDRTPDDRTAEPIPSPTRLPPSPPPPPAPPTTGGSGSGDDDYAVGQPVRVIQGPFADLAGTITEVDSDGEWLQVVVSIFDRETPIRLMTTQIARL